MQGPDLIFIVLPVVIPLALAIGAALRFTADGHAARTQSGRQLLRRAVRARVDARAPDHGLSSSRVLGRPPRPAGRAA